MSSIATRWAMRQRGLKPATKIVLWYLADCHNAQTGACFPMQATIAAECEMSRSSVNDHLDILEERGLIRRDRGSYRLFITPDRTAAQAVEAPATKKPGFCPGKKRRARLYERDGNACVYCGSTDRLTLDHVIPQVRGGSHADDNLVTCCKSCNSSKGTLSVEEWRS